MFSKDDKLNTISEDDIENLGSRNENINQNSDIVLNSNLISHKYIRRLSIISSILLIVTIVISTIMFFTNQKLILISFGVLYDSPFQTSYISILICLFLISAGLLLNIYALISDKDGNYLDNFYKHCSYLYIILNFILIGPFLMGLTNEKTISSIILNFICSLLVTICAIIIYKRIKIRKNPSIIHMFGLNIFISIMLSFLSYVLLFNIFEFIYILNKQEPHSDPCKTLKANLAVALNCLFASGAIICLSTMKDITYALVLLNIEIGYLFDPEMYKCERITALCMVGFISLAVIFTSIVHRKSICGKEDEDLINNLKSANFSSKNIENE